jgi:cytochrome b561
MLDIPKQPVGVRAGWFNLHKSIGLTLGALVVLRLAWRLAHRPPPLPPSLPRWQQAAAIATHRLLYLCLLVMPLSGYLGSSFSGYPVRFFGITLPGWAARNDALKDLFSQIHYAAAAIFMLLIALHAAAALKHLLARDGLFGRMWPGREPAAAPRADAGVTAGR